MSIHKPDGTTEHYLSAPDEGDKMSMPACQFTFDDGPVFEGFSHGSTWNGFDNVAVTPEERKKIAKWLREADDRDGATDIMAIDTMKENGLISLGWGYCTTIVRPKPAYVRKPADALIIAGRFVTILQSWLTPAEFKEMQASNAVETDRRVCHSHDYCDANMAMCEAYESITGKTPDGNSEEETALWNDAWAMAMPALGGKRHDL